MSSEASGKPAGTSTSPDSSSDASSGAVRPAVALPVGTVLRDEYRVEEVLGTGSFGITYRAVDRHLRAAVAIKEYFPRQLATRAGSTLTLRARSSDASTGFEEGLQRFMEEGRTIARFDHPNVVDVRSYFEENGTGYLVMNYYEGASLSEHLARRGGTLSEEEAISLIEDVLAGLSAIHEEGVLHRDVGPKNIYRKEEGEAILIDFGAAREAVGARSQDLSTVLTPGYAPIEQYGGAERQGPWTDVYACAATLYKCLTGEKPPEATRRVQEDPLPPTGEICPGASREVGLAVRKGLALYPERRPQSAEAFGTLLRGDPVEEEGGQTMEATRRGTQVAEESGPERGEVPPSKEAAEEALSEGSPEEAPVETERAASPEEPDQFSWEGVLGPVAIGVAVIASVGGALVFGEASPLQVFAYVGTWIAVCAGLIGLFRQGERLIQPEVQAAVSDWILKEDFAERPSDWRRTFLDLFDSVFTEDHLSWTCFRRSGTVSVATVTVISVGIWTLPGYQEVLPTYFPELVTLFTLIWTFNILIDYISLYETRKVLEYTNISDSVYYHFSIILLDASLTFLIFLASFFVLSIIEIKIFPHPVLGESTYPKTLNPKRPGYSFLLARVVPIAGSTFFTSVWVWLYVTMGLFMRVLHPLLRSLEWLKKTIDIESRPVEAMGLFLAVIASVGFAIGAPFVI